MGMYMFYHPVAYINRGPPFVKGLILDFIGLLLMHDVNETLDGVPTPT
jgi:hypothetical protein